MKKLSLVIVQPVVPDYRVGFFRLVLDKIPNLKILCGSADFAASTTLTKEPLAAIQLVRNCFLLNRSLLWQKGVVSACRTADIVVLNFNIRILSNWVVAIGRRISGRPVLLWGHISGRNRLMGWVRYWMMSLCDGFITYTERERDRLSAMHPKIRTFTAPNACLPRRRARFEEGKARRRILLVGRLVEGKKPLVAVSAFLEAARQGRLHESTGLDVVGDGPLLLEIQELLRNHPQREKVVLVGHVSSENQLEKLYAEAMVALSPGYIGLSAMQSFAFGVPMLIAKDEPHSPEVAICEEGLNTKFVEDVGVKGWAAAIGDFVDGTFQFAEGREMSGKIRDFYSFEAMADGFTDAVSKLVKDSEDS